MFDLHQAITEIDTIVKAQAISRGAEGRLSIKYTPGGEGEDDEIAIILDGADIGIHLQCGYGYVRAHRVVEEPEWALLHLDYTNERGNRIVAIEAALKEALTNEQRDEYVNRERT